ncbi:hypothetical protein FRC12_014041, partial [Ceratobasidium sp. 428]
HPPDRSFPPLADNAPARAPDPLILTRPASSPAIKPAAINARLEQPVRAPPAPTRLEQYSIPHPPDPTRPPDRPPRCPTSCRPSTQSRARCAHTASQPPSAQPTRPVSSPQFGPTRPGFFLAQHALTVMSWMCRRAAAPLPGVPRRTRTPGNNPANVRIGFTLVPPTPPENDPSGHTSAPAPSPGSFRDSLGPTMIATLASPQTALLHVSSSTPLPRLALGPRARRVRARESCESLAPVAFPSSPAVEVLAETKANYVLAPAESPMPKHMPVTPGKNGTLRLSMDAIRAGMRRSNSTDGTKAETATTTPSTTSSVGLRKKSGELVKPSLKHAHTLSGGFPTQAKLSRSAPATPTAAKFVHFDAQLEHVRLFLAEQKPTAVSRGGSPTETSEGEGNEFPWGGRGNSYSYHSSDDERARKTVRIKNTTVPANASIAGADVRLQSLVLADDGASLVGRVLVRNIAFEKWVAVRFTFDSWQTTSEVSARYVDTVAEGIDRFGFSIKLGDVLHRIEEKTLFVAVRYTVTGREIWDSNYGQNYMVAFTKEEEKKPAPVPATNFSWAKRSSRDQMSDLRKSLEKAIQDDEDAAMPQLQIKNRTRPSVRGMSFGGFESKPSVASIVAQPVAQQPAKFGARYDFGAATRERPCADGFRMPTLDQDSFKRPEAPKRASEGDVAKRPVVSTEVKSAFDPKICQSPRDLEDGMRLHMGPVEPLVPSGGFDLESADRAQPAGGRRHHHRAAYFDAWTFPAPGVKRTSSGAPSAEELADQSSIPASWMDVTDLGGSMASTPSVTSASSPSQSPSSPPEFLPSPEIDADLADGLKAGPDVDPSNYSSFLDRFCFFTGPVDHERRTHSRSSSDGYFGGSQYGFGGYADTTAQTLRAVSSSLSRSDSALSICSGSDVAVTPRAGTPVGLETPLPVIAPALN